METKEFPTEVILSVVTGRLLCDISMVYDFLSYMAGEPVYTHQLGRICDEAMPVILAAHPKLSDTVEEAKGIDMTNHQDFAAEWVKRYGPALAVRPLTEAEHKRIDPSKELAEMVGPRSVVAVVVGRKPDGETVH